MPKNVGPRISAPNGVAHCYAAGKPIGEEPISAMAYMFIWVAVRAMLRRTQCPHGAGRAKGIGVWAVRCQPLMEFESRTTGIDCKTALNRNGCVLLKNISISKHLRVTTNVNIICLTTSEEQVTTPTWQRTSNH